MKVFTSLLIGLSVKRVHVRGYVTLETTCGEGENTMAINVSYIIVDALSSYNIIIGLLVINSPGEIISTLYLVMKCLLPGGRVSTIRGDQQITQKNYKNCLGIEREKLTLVASPSMKLKIHTLTVSIPSWVWIVKDSRPQRTVRRIK